MKKAMVFVVALVLASSVIGYASSQSIVSPHGSGASTRFAVIGDYGSGDSNESSVATLVKSWNPDLIITVGDNNYPSGAQETIDQNIGKYYADFIYPYTGAYTHTATTNRFFPALGNHDWYTSNASPYLNYFGLSGNERYYDFIWGAVHFFALDSDPNEPAGISSSGTQATWLRDQMAVSTSCWNLVYFHHAPYSSGPHGSDPTDPGRSMAWDFQAWGADAVFAGHDHDYERISVNGFPYFVNGSGGAGLYTFGAPVAGSQMRYNAKHGALRVTATFASLTYEFIAVDGTVVETYAQAGGCSLFLPLVVR